MNLLWELGEIISSPLSPVLWQPSSRTVRAVILEFTFFTLLAQDGKFTDICKNVCGLSYNDQK
jgi:hypothetical protein